ncbi:DNA repair protein rad14 [Coemansia sp. RSA 552]|nr:DNA repair protein rad14 [Coemansia sp. RSA 552]
MSSLTPGQLARIEANRKQALERRKASEQQAHERGKASEQPAADGPPPRTERLRATRMSTGYYEYNLSTMRDTKAGFLEEEPTHSPEKKRKVVMVDELPYDPDPEEDLSCCECGSIDLDVVYLKIFKVKVCKPCIEKLPDHYSLLTKTEAKEDYLLTDGELRDRELFPVWEKANPHKSTWNNMLLYLRRDLERFAIKKWGGLPELDREFERREEEKRVRKETKYQRSVADLRRRTRADQWEKERRERLRLENEHEHTFEPTGNGDDEQKCTACGLVIEVEEF